MGRARRHGWRAVYIALSACGADPLAPASRPTSTDLSIADADARPHPDALVRDFEHELLSFIDGCWSFWNVDYGERLCWTRTTSGWRGELAIFGPMARPATAALEITTGPDQRARLAVHADGDLLAGCADMRAVVLTPGSAVFTDGVSEFSMRMSDAGDALTVVPCGVDHAYEFARPVALE